MSWRRAVVVQDIAENAGRRDEQLLRLLSCAVAITYPSYFLGFDSFDERLVVAEARPGAVVEVIFWFYGVFGQQALAVPGAVCNEIVVIFEGYWVIATSDASERPSKPHDEFTHPIAHANFE
jgi:hypothetical protein